MCNVVSRGQYFSTSRLFVPILDTFKTTRAETSLLISTYMAVYMCSVKRYGPKLSGMVGTLVTGCSIAGSYFATSITYLIISQGVFVGIGQSLIQISCLTVVSQSFKGKAQYVALSLVGVGPGVGCMLYTYFAEYSLQHYGLRGTFLITGGLALNALAPMLSWPRTFKKPTTKVQVNSIQDGKETQQEAVKKRSNDLRRPSNVLTAKTSNVKRVLRVKYFALVSAGPALTLSAQTTFIMFITDLIIERNMYTYLSSLTIFIYSLLNTTGRLVPGFMKLIPNCSSVTIPLVGSLFAITASVLVVYTDTSTEYVVVVSCCLSGLAYGIATSSISVTTVKLLGSDNIATGTGSAMTLSGICTLIAGPLNGLVKDMKDSYTTVYMFTATASGVSGSLLLVA